MNTHDILAALVERAACKPGWTFRITEEHGSSVKNDSGLVHTITVPTKRLVIGVAGYDSSQPDKQIPMTVLHFFPVPEATYNIQSWRRWIFDCCRGVENHELGEWFRIDSLRPFQPLHGPGENPYVVHEFRPEIDALTTQDGSVREPYGQ